MNSDNWPAPPLIPGDWKTLSVADATAVLARYSAAEIVHGQDPSAVGVEYSRVRARRMLSAPNWLLLEAEATFKDGASGLLTFFYGPGLQIVPAAWAPALFRELDWLKGTKAGALPVIEEYLHLFVNYTHGDEGRFIIVPDKDGLRMLDSGAALPETGIVEKMVPLKVSGDTPPYKGTSTVAYAGQLFNAEFSIEETGQIDMTDDDQLGPVAMRKEEIRGPFRVFPKPGQLVPHPGQSAAKTA